MEKLMELDILVEKIDGRSMILSRPDLTRALETIWDLFFGHFDTMGLRIGICCHVRVRFFPQSSVSIGVLTWHLRFGFVDLRPDLLPDPLPDLRPDPLPDCLPGRDLAPLKWRGLFHRRFKFHIKCNVFCTLNQETLL